MRVLSCILLMLISYSANAVAPVKRALTFPPVTSFFKIRSIVNNKFLSDDQIDTRQQPTDRLIYREVQQQFVMDLVIFQTPQEQTAIQASKTTVPPIQSGYILITEYLHAHHFFR